jgi:hypothetical protein
MSKQLYRALKNCLAITSAVNAAAKTGNGEGYSHEDAVEAELVAAGFTELNKDNFPKLSKSKIKKWAVTCNDSVLLEFLKGMPSGSFITQPAGSHGMPDILIRDFCGRLIGWECKSGKNGICPMWNDNLPKQNITYILMSGKRQESTIFLGRDVITNECDSFWAAAGKEIDEWYKNKLLEAGALGLDKYNRGFFQKLRKQHFQKQGKAAKGSTRIEKTNYFKHKDRAKCEQSALDYAKQ